MFRSFLRYLCLLLIAGFAVASPTIASAQGCKDQRWCLEAEHFAFRVTPEEMTIEFLRHLQSQPDGASIGAVIDYLIHNGRERVYLAWLRPTPGMHSVAFEWNVGLELESGEIVWSKKWLFERQGSFGVYDPNTKRIFTPGVNGMSSGGHSFLVFLAFPESGPDGKEWKSGKVSGLVIE